MRLHDTLSGELIELPPPPEEIGMYVCGPTVYQRAHIGNARPYVIGSWVARWLRHRGQQVKLVHNITDVNDKIYEAAPEASAARAAEATEWYLDDVGRFGLDEVDSFPKVTEAMDEIIDFIARLVESGHAYPVNGDVYFRVASLPDYGSLSGQRLDQMEDSEPNPLKDDPRDFALWKGTKAGEDTAWDSPWGRGRPGWHIECSAMAANELGPSFWIHGGGLDLVFPHHENELAQSHAVGYPFAKVWMHNGMLRFTGEKMSKSVGNIATIEEVLDEWGRETALLFFLTAHWRKPLDFSVESMGAAAAQAESFREVFRRAPTSGVGAAPGPLLEWSDFKTTLDDDFNTPAALAVMHGWRTAGHLGELRRALAIFGLESLAETVAAPAGVVALAEQRQVARADRNWVEADVLRDQILAAGWVVRDVPDGFELVPAA